MYTERLHVLLGNEQLFRAFVVVSVTPENSVRGMLASYRSDIEYQTMIYFTDIINSTAQGSPFTCTLVTL